MREFKKIAVAGAGTMGTVIVRIFAENGYKAVLYNRGEASLVRAKKTIEDTLANSVKLGKYTNEQAVVFVKSIKFTTNKNDFCDADFVVENIVEDLETKKQLFREISAILPEDAVITTNTSGLSVTELGKAVYNPERFVGMNWWNPPDLIPLVEVVKGKMTSQETAESAMAVVKSVGKEPVLVKNDIKGFIGNRLQFALLREALYIVENGDADVEDVDKVLRFGLGMRYACLGPFETADFGGVDVYNSIASGLFGDLCNNKEGSALLQKLVDEKKLGVKNGKGFYDYGEGKKEELLQKRNEGLKNIAKYIHKNN